MPQAPCCREPAAAAAVLAAAVAARALNQQSEQARTALAAADALMDRLLKSERTGDCLAGGLRVQVRFTAPRAT
ncbi:hypothetical protein [Streptomyces sp. NPDC126514]|uniref:hypothetical protein n=1 Tax=Streptomyces sp. NPDC126514 TaxID=3155210 RepID=UPI003329A480